MDRLFADERLILVCLLISSGLDAKDVEGYVEALGEGIEAGEPDALEQAGRLLVHAAEVTRENPYHDVIRLAFEFRTYRVNSVKMEKAAQRIQELDALLAQAVGNGNPLARRIAGHKAAAMAEEIVAL